MKRATHSLRSIRSCRHMTISFLPWSATIYLMAGIFQPVQGPLYALVTPVPHD